MGAGDQAKQASLRDLVDLSATAVAALAAASYGVHAYVAVRWDLVASNRCRGHKGLHIEHEAEGCLLVVCPNHNDHQMYHVSVCSAA